MYRPEIMSARSLHVWPLLASLLTVASFATAGEPAWPQFRGPGGTGVAEASNPPLHFGPEENVAWKVPMAAGNSSPIVWSDRLFVTTFHDGSLETLCLRRSDGSPLWHQYA